MLRCALVQHRLIDLTIRTSFMSLLNIVRNIIRKANFKDYGLFHIENSTRLSP